MTETVHTPRSVLVTGGAGFIGTRLCDLLRASGWIVHSASRREVGAASAHQHWQVDLTNADATKASTSVLLRLIFDGVIYQHTQGVIYSAKAGRSGSAKASQ